MRHTATNPVANASIHLINTLGGPQLPTGVSVGTLNVILENFAAAETIPSSCRIASYLASRRA